MGFGCVTIIVEKWDLAGEHLAYYTAACELEGMHTASLSMFNSISEGDSATSGHLVLAIFRHTTAHCILETIRNPFRVTRVGFDLVFCGHTKHITMAEIRLRFGVLRKYTGIG